MHVAKGVVAFVVVASGWPLPALGAEQAGKPPDEYAITITGRILSESRKPLAGMPIMISETDPEKVAITVRTDAPDKLPSGVLVAVKLLNPLANTDANGRFTIPADRRFWQSTGHFALHGGLVPGTGNMQADILRKPSGDPIVVRPDSKTRTIDLGDIVVAEKHLKRIEMPD
jgi:hypothetical protein